MEPLPNLVEPHELDSLDPLPKGADVGLFVVLNCDCLVSVAVFLADFGLQLVKKFGSLLTSLFLAFPLFIHSATVPAFSLAILLDEHIVRRVITVLLITSFSLFSWAFVPIVLLDLKLVFLCCNLILSRLFIVCAIFLGQTLEFFGFFLL